MQCLLRVKYNLLGPKLSIIVQTERNKDFLLSHSAGTSKIMRQNKEKMINVDRIKNSELATWRGMIDFL